MKYKFEGLTEIENPTIKVIRVLDDFDTKTCEIEVKASVAGSKTQGIRLTGFTYQTTWEDADIENFVQQKIKDFEI